MKHADVPLVPGDYKRAWESARVAIGYEHKIRPRDLRHSYAEHSSTSGDIVSTSKTLGHASLKTTSIYVHGDGSRAAVAPLRMAQLMGFSDPFTVTPSDLPEGVSVHSEDCTGDFGVEVNGFEPMTCCVQSRLTMVILQVLPDFGQAATVADHLVRTGAVDWSSDPLTGTPMKKVG